MAYRELNFDNHPVMTDTVTNIIGCSMRPLRGNVDYDVGDEIDIADLVYLVDYMFNGGPEPPACPLAFVEAVICAWCTFSYTMASCLAALDATEPSPCGGRVFRLGHENPRDLKITRAQVEKMDPGLRDFPKTTGWWLMAGWETIRESVCKLSGPTRLG